jgi:hypothetical protein
MVVLGWIAASARDSWGSVICFTPKLNLASGATALGSVMASAYLQR